jgi:dolichyl-phosphate-mannose--protein O-mannosyl transferase
LAVTLLYVVLTLLNLGTLSFPEETWSPKAGDRVVLDFGGSVDVHSVWVNGNIGTGAVRFTADNGAYYDYQQTFAEMFTWRKKTLAFQTQYLTLEVLSDPVCLNEIAFFDPNGQPLAAQYLRAEDSNSGLLDEQDTVPDAPSYFNGMYFDEIYHARTAYEFLNTMSVYEWTHPPLGKIIIALGVAIFGMTPFGWRVMPALFGAGMLPVVYILAKRLTRRRDFSLLAMGLWALDTMHFTQTRIATVDVFIGFFILLMYLFMYDYLRTDFFREPLKKALLPLGLCGLSFGLGVASKWTGLYAGAGLAVLFFWNLIAKGIKARGDKTLWPEYLYRAGWTVLFCCGVFVLLPAVIYFLSYIPFFRYEASVSAEPYGLREAIRTIVVQQESMFAYHSGLDATHMCQSAWYQWPFTAVSVWFYYSGGEAVSNISSTGSPAVWWVSTVGTLCLMVEILFGRMKKAAARLNQGVRVVFIGMAASYLPWVLVPRCTFQYHFFPVVPFLILAAVLLLQHMEENREISPKAKWIWLGVAAVFFALLFPVISGIPVSETYARFVEYVLPGGLLFHGAI